MTNVAPPGWYVDPSNAGFEHWWDGTQYVQSRAVAQPEPQAVAYYEQPAAHVPQAPAAQYQQPQQVVQHQVVHYAAARPAGVSPKSRTVAALLGFFLGGLGVDRFYLGNIGLGVAKLFLGWLTLGIWPLVDWIIILAGSARDGDGLRVTEWS